ncbi:MAG: UDP-N-acetylmuramoyl-L-alanine--D-glutamate ligase, partial [Hyphomicrobiaceae bacterium]
MIPVTTFAGRTVAVFGLARSGLATAAALIEGGAAVWAWDDGEKGREAAEKAGLTTVDLAEADWSEIAALVLSPGVPLTHPEPHWTVKRAHDAGVEIIGDTELFFRERAATGSQARVIAITGTNGKSTTTALVAHILRNAGVPTELGGNIGDAILGLEPLQDDRAYVIEFSSYQIDLTPSLHPNAAALLNISPDHLDRHGTLENYAAVKARIFANLTASDTAVIGVDDPLSAAIAEHIPKGPGVVHVSVTHDLADGIRGKDAKLWTVSNGDAVECADLSANLALRGKHNWQNAAVAYVLTSAVGVTPDAITAGLATFPGLEHRLEFVGQVVTPNGQILFLNDSKGTNAEAAAHALAAYNDIFWIAGGQAKDGGIEDLRPLFPRVRHAYLVGESAEDFAATLGDDTPSTNSGTIAKAVIQATTDAAKSGLPAPVVLLSPAAASFDQFPNFEIRGQAFKDASLWAVSNGDAVGCADLSQNLALRGKHNWQNAAAAYVLTSAIGIA